MVERLKEGVTEFVVLTNHRAPLEVFSFAVTSQDFWELLLGLLVLNKRLSAWQNVCNGVALLLVLFIAATFRRRYWAGNTEIEGDRKPSLTLSNHILFYKMIERLKEGVTEFVILTNHRAALEVFSFDVTTKSWWAKSSENCYFRIPWPYKFYKAISLTKCLQWCCIAAHFIHCY